MAEPILVSGGKRTVIDALSLAPLHSGTLSALVGPNAAGKSTLLRAIAGDVPTKGSVRLSELDLLRVSIPERTHHLVHMPQTLPGGAGLTVLETLLGALRAVPGSAADDPVGRALAMLERPGSADLALSGLDQLPGGQRQLVALAQALVREPAVALLDEPMRAPDLRHQLSVMSMVRAVVVERQLIGVVVVHDLGLAARR